MRYDWLGEEGETMRTGGDWTCVGSTGGCGKTGGEPKDVGCRGDAAGSRAGILTRGVGMRSVQSDSSMWRYGRSSLWHSLNTSVSATCHRPRSRSDGLNEGVDARCLMTDWNPEACEHATAISLSPSDYDLKTWTQADYVIKGSIRILILRMLIPNLSCRLDSKRIT